MCRYTVHVAGTHNGIREEYLCRTDMYLTSDLCTIQKETRELVTVYDQYLPWTGFSNLARRSLF